MVRAAQQLWVGYTGGMNLGAIVLGLLGLALGLWAGVKVRRALEGEGEMSPRVGSTSARGPGPSRSCCAAAATTASGGAWSSAREELTPRASTSNTEAVRAPHERVKLQGFNNLTKVVSFNMYDFFVARTEAERMAYIQHIDARYSAERITKTLEEIARIIDADVLSVSKQDYEPHGASSLVLMSDIGQSGITESDVAAAKRACNKSVGVHLTKSHLVRPHLPGLARPPGHLLVSRGHHRTCGTIVPLAALDYMFEQFENDVVIIDYVVRGFTRDTDGNRVFLDHKVGSIQDYVNPQILESYHCEDLIMQRENIWQTKCLRTRLEPANFFPEGTDLERDENAKAFEDVKREMAGIFYGWPS